MLEEAETLFDKRVLIVEDDPVTGAYLCSVLQRENFDAVLAEDGQRGLDLYKSQFFDIVVSDLNMPVMGGRQLLEELNRLSFKPVFIVATENNESNTIIELMKKGVADYFIKPINPVEFIFKIKNAVQLARLRRTENMVQHEREKRMDHNLDWNSMKERVVARTYDKFDRILFSGMNRSFNQGAGIGSLVSVASLIENSCEEKEDHYAIRKDLLNLLFHNAGIARRALTLISEIHAITEKKISLNEMNASELYDTVRQKIHEKMDFSLLRNHKIVFNDPPARRGAFSVAIDREYFFDSIYELFINALKFSDPKSEIYIFCNYTDDHFFLSIMNKPDLGLSGPDIWNEEYRNLIFEPFFRLAKFVHEEYETLDLGLGLTFVEKVIRHHRGEIMVTPIHDKSHLHKQADNLRLSFEITLPLLQGRKSDVNSTKDKTEYI